MRTLTLSLVVLAAACTGKTEPPPRRVPFPASPADGWVTFRHPEQGWTWRHPPGWHVQTFHDDVGLATHAGAVLSNVRHRFGYPHVPDGATSHWDFRKVPETAVVVEMSQTIRLGSRCSRTTETPVQLGKADVARGAYGSPPRRWLPLCSEGLEHFGLHVWVGEGAALKVVAATRKVVRSLRLNAPAETADPGDRVPGTASP